MTKTNDMFSYRLPNGGLITKTYITNEGQIKFDPPVYEQRYSTAVRIIEDPCWKQPLKKIVDFGCAEVRLLQLIRRIPFVEHILEVDIDAELLKVHQQKAIPLISDYLQKRENPLRVEILVGSVTDAVEQLYDVDVVIALELIEHLHKEELEKFPENVFGFVQPKLAIVSTPNSEFNVLFDGLLENGFRHHDHKFEWTRDEFKKWAHDICKKYPNYSVAFMGLGKPPSTHRKIGYSTQMAIFARNDMLDRPLRHEIVKNPPVNTEAASYTTIYAVDFPYNKDERSKEQKIIDETRYFISQSRHVPLYFNRERFIYQLPWKSILEYTISLGGTEKEMFDILEANGIKVEGDFIILPEYDDDDDDYRDDIVDCDDDDYWNNSAGSQQPRSDDELSQLTLGCQLNTSNTSYESEENWD
ncbi:hen1 methyltransferase isoform X1 [Musca autumnalis]|uniref:hen1 methyltransferase isoform X1 n=1 Tax=Musca autumnalis TaxID=221902 RepID=UPI003CF739F5